MKQLKIFLLGRFQLKFSDQEIDDFGSAKAQELLCYLLLRPGKFHHRETIANYLWQDVSATRSKQYLRRALWQLQNVLSPWQSTSMDVLIIVEDDWIYFNPQISVWVDALRFKEICLRYQGKHGQNLNQESADELQEAIRLYQSHLLDGWYQDWCIFERERFRQLFLSSLDKLMIFCEFNGDYELGVEYGTQILRYDPAREHTHRHLMRLKYLSGNRVGALRQYSKCMSILAKELDIEPSDSTQTLFKQIQAASLESLLDPSIELNGHVLPKHAFLQKAYDELQQIHSVLTHIQKRIQYQIELVESSLD